MTDIETTPMPDDLAVLHRRLNAATGLQHREEAVLGWVVTGPSLLAAIVFAIALAWLLQLGPLPDAEVKAVSDAFSAACAWLAGGWLGLIILLVILTQTGVIPGAKPDAYSRLIAEVRTAIDTHPWTVARRVAELAEPPAKRESKSELAARARIERKIRSTDGQEG